MEIEYADSQGNSLCFRHAVKKAIENNEDIRATIDESDPGESGWFSFCMECSKEN